MLHELMASAVVAMLTETPETASTTPQVIELQATSTIPLTPRQEIMRVFGQEDGPLMMEVARCESGVKQFNKDGTLLRGVVDPRDVGIFQVNSWYHEEQATQLGLDLKTLEGNVAYAKILFDKRRLRDWQASSRCWS